MDKMPSKIYLQIGDHNFDDICGEEVTWCRDKIEDSDIEYNISLPKYCTPAQYKEITGEDWPGDGPVWIKTVGTNYKGQKVSNVIMQAYGDRETYPLEYIIIANESGKPPKDYSPEV